MSDIFEKFHDAVTINTDEPNATIKQEKYPNNTIHFCVGDKEIMSLTEQGMIYNGQLIEDAGDAHGIFMEVIHLIREG